MNPLRELLANLIGAEIQAHQVTVAGRTSTLHFKQFDDATGREIFALVEGESIEDRGLRIMRGVIAASLCQPDGELVGTLPQVATLPSVVLEPLYRAAAITNNVIGASEPEAEPLSDNADPGDEASSPKA